MCWSLREKTPRVDVAVYTSARPKTSATIEKAAAELTAYYSDKKQGDLSVRFGRGGFNKSLKTPIPNEKEVEDLRVTSQKAPAQFRARKNWDESEKLEK